MTAMRAIQIDQIRKPVALREIPIPKAGEDDALVRGLRPESAVQTGIFGTVTGAGLA